MSAIPHADPKPAVNYVFVDYENVHHVDLSLIGGRAVYFTLLLGVRQSTLDAALVEKLLAHASSVQLVRLTSSGKNSLDFALAFYLGRAVHADPTAYFHIVSKDAGFDPLIEHLQSRHVKVRRHEDYSSLTFSYAPKPAPAAPVTPDELLTRVVAHLQKNVNNRPKRKKTLVSHLLTFCGKSASTSAIDDLILRLAKGGFLAIGESEAVTYRFIPQ